MSDFESIIRVCISSIWQDYDADKDGKLSFEECLNFVEVTYGEMEPPEVLDKVEFRKLFDEVDNDTSGKIDQEEFITFMKAFTHMSHKEKKEEDCWPHIDVLWWMEDPEKCRIRT